MRNLLVVSALTSLLMMCSYSAFSDEALDGVLINNNKSSNNSKSSLSNVVIKGGRIKFSGSMMSYSWYSSDNTMNPKKFGGYNKRFNVDVGGNIDNTGAKHDAMLSIGIDSSPNKYGVTYGAYSQINILHADGRSFGNSIDAFNKGSKIFVRTPYGNLSLGYQEGVESIMKLNAFSLVAGDNYNIWTRHLRNIMHELKDSSGYTAYHFNFNSGLYSETFFRHSDNLVFNQLNDNVTVDILARNFINNLPFRLSYQSRNFMGLRFGVSYSPFGYDQKILGISSMERTKLVNKDVIIPRISGTNHMKKATDMVLVGPKYKHIVSGGISYTYDFKNLKFGASIIGEYGNEYSSDYTTYYTTYFKHNKLKAISVGWTIGYDKIVLAGSYGNLNSSGIPYARCTEFGGCAAYWRFLKDVDYYWDVGIAYKYAPLNFSVIYFKSNRVGNQLDDISVGIEYDFLKYNTFKGSLFANYHYYTFNQFCECVEVNIESKGNILLVGAKLDF